MKLKAARCIFSGRVQGVFFRAFTRNMARANGVTGWVRNLPGGEVEALFEGEHKAVQSAIESCRVGPPASHVEDVEVFWEDPGEGHATFDVKL